MANDGKKYQRINPYPSRLLWILDEICLSLLRLFRLPFDEFLATFVPTTTEVKTRSRWIIKRTLVMPFILIAMAITFPISLTSYIIWLTFQHKKKPYRISISGQNKEHEQNEGLNNIFSFATTNLCLLPESFSRFNNQTDPAGRSHKQGQRIAQQQLHARSCLRNNINSYESTNPHKRNGFNRAKSKDNDSINHEVLEEFPPLDILLVQEAWVKEYTESLVDELHKVFPYIIYDVGFNTWADNCYLSNSGQLIASRYPILEIQFNSYDRKASQCRLASKGLLQIKVLVKKTADHDYVGYAYTTHLQAYQGTRPIHKHQLNDVTRWTNYFRQNTLKPRDIVVFDILGGDFNLDNSSPVDKEDWSHPVFDVYKDYGRIRPGLDQPWAVGTEMAHMPLHDDLIQTPAGLKHALDDPLLLHYYVMDGTIEDLKYAVAWDMPEVDEHGNQIWHHLGGKRRIDYIMHRQVDKNVKALSWNAVTQMAGLTDHIPFSLTIQVDGLPELL